MQLGQKHFRLLHEKNNLIGTYSIDSKEILAYYSLLIN